MKEFRELTVKEKALKINLDHSIYGSFAEIGAGQEVAANFFKAGGASGTIAQTRSAYDMKISDTVYGTCERYVCEPRLITMLQKEFELLNQNLSEKAAGTKFFAFANTVQTINFNRTKPGHGWLGIKFQIKPLSTPNECIIHVNLNDNTPLLQQEALGILGVNLIYACTHLYNQPENLLNSLIAELGRERIEIDMFRLSGPDFQYIDNRLLSLKLVKNGLADASMFGPDGTVLLPQDALYKKNVMILGGRFRPVTKVNINMFECGKEAFLKDVGYEDPKLIELSALTLQNLSSHGEIDDQDFLDRVDILCSLGKHVLITKYHEHYQLIRYVSPLIRDKKLALILGVYNLLDVFNSNYYKKLKGGMLEAFGNLFRENVKLYIYPSFRPGTKEIVNIHQLEIEQLYKGLLQYIIDNKFAIPLENADTQYLHILSDQVIAMIKKGELGWEELVPDEVAKQIIDRCLFEYPCVPMAFRGL
jgi:hypothetical protein